MSNCHSDVPREATFTVAELLRGVFDGSIHLSKYQLLLLDADDSGACSLSFQPVSGTTFNVGTEEEGASNDEQ